VVRNKEKYMMAVNEEDCVGIQMWFLRLVIMVLLVNGEDESRYASETGENQPDLSARKKSEEGSDNFSKGVQPSGPYSEIGRVQNTETLVTSNIRVQYVKIFKWR
jgi:hypothetical protein